MQSEKKRPYNKPEVKEVKLAIEDTLMTACRAGLFTRTNPRRGIVCLACRFTFRPS